MGLSVGDKFPSAPLKKWGLSGKPAVISFSASTKQAAAAFQSALSDFSARGVTVCGVLDSEGSWNVFSENYDLKFVVDSDDAVRESIGISREMFGLLEKRDSYLIDSKGDVKHVCSTYLDTDTHAAETLAAAKASFDLLSNNAGFFKFGQPIFRRRAIQMPKALIEEARSNPITIRPNQAHRPQRITIEVD